MGFSAIKILYPRTPQPGFARSYQGERRTELRHLPGADSTGPQGLGSQDHPTPPMPASIAAQGRRDKLCLPGPRQAQLCKPRPPQSGRALRCPGPAPGEAAGPCAAQALRQVTLGLSGLAKTGPESWLTIYSSHVPFQCSPRSHCLKGKTLPSGTRTRRRPRVPSRAIQSATTEPCQ